MSTGALRPLARGHRGARVAGGAAGTGGGTPRATCPSLLRPSFGKLEQWLETLRMHLDIHLPLSSQLEQLTRAFWETHRRGEGGLPPHPELPDRAPHLHPV